MSADAGVLRVPVLGAPVDADVVVPGSKSIANRALVCAALAAGDSRLSGVAPGDDTAAMLACLRVLGVVVDVDGDAATVAGRDGRLAPTGESAQARLAGTTSRFVTALAALAREPVVVDGDPPLRRRPMGPLHDALARLGATVTPLEGEGQLPVRVAGPLRGGEVAMPGDVSSQYVTALMLVAPYLPDGLEIRLTSELVSRPYVEITRAVMASFGVPSVDVDERVVRVAPGRYRGTAYVVEPDASSASYPLAVAAVAGGRVRVPGLGPDALQGDARLADLLAAMGCEVVRDEHGTTVRRDPGATLVGLGDVDLADVSDLVPTVAVVAATASTPTRITGVGFIRAKESDRLGALAGELRRTGADVQETGDGLAIGPAPSGLHGARLATHHDHRLAMAFGVLGSVVPGIEVEDPGVVSKSWPGYWDALAGIRSTAGTSTS